MTAPRALHVQNLSAGYDGRSVIADVSLELHAGKWTTIIGPNGAGKSTVLRAVFGTAEVHSGSIAVYGNRTTGLPTHRMSALGVAFAPQGGQVFGDLLAFEDVAVGGTHLDAHQLPERLASVFAEGQTLHMLRRRIAATLSGGEKQVLALARNQLANPQLLLLDEPTAALSPGYAERMLVAMRALCTEGAAILAVEQRVDVALAHSDDILILRLGRAVDGGPARRFREETSWRRHFVG